MMGVDGVGFEGVGFSGALFERPLRLFSRVSQMVQPECPFFEALHPLGNSTNT